MFTFLKANFASLIASACDYVLTIFAVQYLEIDVVLAGILGTITGGIINFWIGRNWVFLAEEGKPARQAGRYAIVWFGNLLLNAVGMYSLTKHLNWHYAMSKVITSVIVAAGYNYPLQKRYVFRAIRD